MDKVQKIREEVEKLKSQLLRGACSSQIAMETSCKEEAYNEVLALLDSLQEEPVSKDYRERYKRIAESEQFKKIYEGMSVGEVVHIEGEEPVSEDLGEYINELSKQFPEVSFAKLSRIAVRVAKWQAEQFEKDYTDLCNGIATAKGIAVKMAYDKGMDDAKKQMMAKAIDADVVVDRIGEVVYLCTHKKEITCKKVKIIVIKEC